MTIIERDEGAPVVAITGASRGIGLSLALEFRRRGWEVVACVRDPERLPSALRGPGVQVEGVDLAQPAQVEQLAAQLAVTPRLHGLVNNAALQLVEPTTEALALQLQVNVAAPLTLTQALAATLSVPGGFIANVSSGLAHVPHGRTPVYAATKAAVSHYTRSLALQRRAGGPLLVEVVLPMVDTDMTRGRGGRKLSPERAASEIVEGILAGRQRVFVGPARLLPWLVRLLPGLAERLLNRAGSAPARPSGDSAPRA